MSHRLRLPLALLASSALALSACGGDDNGGGSTTAGGGGGGGGGDDEAAITEVVEGYTQAFADGDGDKACGYLAASAREEIEAVPEAGGCSDVIGQAIDMLDDDGKQQLADLKVTQVTIDGDRATVESEIEGAEEQPNTAIVVKEDGEWKIAPDQTAAGETATAEAPEAATVTAPTVTTP